MRAHRKLILFFNSFFGRWPQTDGLACCEDCEFATDRSRLPEADAVVFHLPGIRQGDRVAKYPGQQWVVWCMESAVTCPGLADPALMRLFEISMTYQQHADVWVPYFRAGDDVPLLKPPPAKSESSPVVHFQSHRYDRSGRTRYAAELMKRVKIDSYGKVLNNRKLAVRDDGADTMRQVIARYKFALAFENSIAPDYVTDKFFDPLVVGTVPIYLGAPNVAELAPAEHCFINTADFAGPSEIAAYLNFLNENDDAYQAYFSWKAKGLSERFRAHLQAVARPPLCRLCDRVRPRAIRLGSSRSDEAQIVGLTPAKPHPEMQTGGVHE